MLRDDLLLRARLTPPRPNRRTLPRPALTARLQEAFAYRLTLLQAGTGYGKSTALAALAAQPEAGPALFWYSASESDTDPQRFLAYLVGAFRTRLPALSDLPQTLLQELGQAGRADAWPQVVDALLNALAEALPGPALLIVDDYHFAGASPEVAALTERFLAHLPPDLHVLLSTRSPLHSPALTAWRVRDEVLDITRADLAFGLAEIESLFRETYGMRLTTEEAAALLDKTEGWPIALQLVWQGVRLSERSGTGPRQLLAAGPALESRRALFDYLAHEVLGRQPPAVAAFLRDTALLRELTPGACAAVAGAPEAEAQALLQRLLDADLFMVPLAERHYRYHHLFHDFLRGAWAGAEPGARERHRRAAGYFRVQGDFEEALYHSLAASEFEAAAGDLEQIGETRLRAGRLEAVAAWIDALPPETVAEHPLVQRFLGDICRLRSRFDEALAWYRQAEQTWRARGDLAGVSRALRGQALVYLDTVRPVEAEKLLAEALRHMQDFQDPAARARLLELLAENKLNMGKPQEAEQLRGEARAIREEGPTEDVLSVRVKLRTGRLDEARRILEGWLAAERQAAGRGQGHPPRAHRETVLLLSLIDSLLGETEAAFALADEGVTLGERLNSPFVTTVGLMRLGHAWQLRAGAAARAEAIQRYQAAITLGDQLAVRRLRAEVMWGLTRAYGLGPGADLAAAERAAAEGVEICRWAGDQWVAALVELALGSSYVLAGRLEPALDVLGRSLSGFRECGDPLGRAAARAWLGLAHLELGQSERCAVCAEELLALCEAHQYDFFFTRPTLLGPPDPRRLMPLLLEARARRIRPAYVARLLNEIGLPGVQVHPGYQLRVQTLGAFRVWRGAELLDPREWKREKARQLFQLLLTERRPWQREEITERLWPALAPEAAGRDFKVALNALFKALEPARPAEAPSAFIARDGPTYQLRPEADLWLDAAEFERAAEAGLRLAETGDAAAGLGYLQAALPLYTGDYLPEALYEDWATEARERLLALYLRAADRLAGLLVAQGRYADGLAVCQLILARDPCWERAYRLMMLAYARQGSRPQAVRAFQRCQAALQAELDVAPSPATLALFDRINRAEDLGGVEV
ncbi:MAG: tetratricopeptide repeat protein [Anaerolineales bacterium]|nr:tetratricopeptide repeat protein [Anaerolineales bacterium]